MSSDAEFDAYLAEGSASLLRYAYLLTGDPHRAQDLTQETLVRVYEARRRVDTGMFPAYARRTMYNLSVSWWRRLTSREEALPEDLDTVGSTGDGADARAGRAEMIAAIRCLPTKTRTAMTLYYYEDWPPAQIAEILDSSEQNVRALLTRGRTALRANLQTRLVGRVAVHEGETREAWFACDFTPRVTCRKVPAPTVEQGAGQFGR